MTALLHLFVALQELSTAVADPGVVPGVPEHHSKFHDDPGLIMA